jgi:signal transduction histidine kinase/ligand-binding sensor domain-containing protein
MLRDCVLTLCLFILIAPLALVRPLAAEAEPRVSSPAEPQPQASPRASAAPYDVAVWTTEQGLPGDTVRAVVQTRDGYLWVGTQAGLARFDGVRFTVFNQKNVPQLRAGECSTLLEGRDGSLWIGTIGGGLTRYKEGRFETWGRAEGLASDVVNQLYEDRAGRLWITSYERLTVFESGAFRTYGPGEGVESVYAVPFHEDAEGRLWIFNSLGLNPSNSGTLTFYQDGKLHAGAEAPPLFPKEAGADALPLSGRGNTLWLRERRAGRVFRANSAGRESFLFDFAGGAGEALRYAHEDEAGHLWAVSARGAVYRWGALGGTPELIAQPEALPRGAVNALYVDLEGNLWLGTNDGLARLKSRAFVSLTREDGLAAERAWTIFEDSRGGLWIGTDGGLSRWRDGRFETFRVRDGLAGDATITLTEDREGRIWAGSPAGLSVLEGERFRAYGRDDGLLSTNVRAVHADRRGRLWVGTVAGLHLFDGERFRAYATTGPLAQGNVLFIAEDRAGSLWVGTSGGLNRIREGRVETFTTRDGLGSNLAVGMHEDADGALWFGTVGGGLARYRDGKFVAITMTAGLADDTVTRVLEDDEGSLWLGTLRGVMRVARGELNDYADGRTKSVGGVVYGKADGLLSIDCSGGTQPAGWRTRDGRLWFPTARGVSFVAPQRLRRNDRVPPVHVESIVVDKVESEARAGIELPAGSRAVEFHFTALSFTDPEKVRFRYRLEGFDREWVEAGARREAFYTNLPPGRYRFRVAAANDDGVWNEEGATLAFTLKPYFYQTYWFYLLCLAAVALLAWGVYRLRVRQLRREFAAVLGERNRIARELHDTLAQGFTSVSMRLEMVSAKLEGDAGAAREHLNQARLLVRASLAEARRSVRDLRSELLGGDGLGAALGQVARQLTGGEESDAEVAVTGKPRPLPEAVERNLLRVGQEAMTNAVRHSAARRIRVRLDYGDCQVSLKVTDDGCGFDPRAAIVSSDGGGFGLRGMRERLAEVGGELIVESRPGGGTQVLATVPAGEQRPAASPRAG